MLDKPTNWDEAAAYPDARIDIKIEISAGFEYYLYTDDVDSNGVTVEMMSSEGGRFGCVCSSRMSFTLVDFSGNASLLNIGASVRLSVRMTSDEGGITSGYADMPLHYIDNIQINESGGVFVSAVDAIGKNGDRQFPTSSDGSWSDVKYYVPGLTNSDIEDTNFTVPAELIASGVSAREVASHLATRNGCNYVMNHTNYGQFISATSTYSATSSLPSNSTLCTAGSLYVDSKGVFLSSIEINYGGTIKSPYYGYAIKCEMPSEYSGSFSYWYSKFKSNSERTPRKVIAREVEMTPLLQRGDRVAIYNNGKYHSFTALNIRMTINGNCWGEIDSGPGIDDFVLVEDSTLSTLVVTTQTPSLTLLGSRAIKASQININIGDAASVRYGILTKYGGYTTFTITFRLTDGSTVTQTQNIAPADKIQPVFYNSYLKDVVFMLNYEAPANAVSIVSHTLKIADSTYTGGDATRLSFSASFS